MITDFESVLGGYLAEVERKYGMVVQFLDKFNEELGGRHLVLYGVASIMGGSVLEIFKERGLTVSCFCDPLGLGDMGDIPVIGPQTLKNDFANATVVVCTHSQDHDFAADVTALGFKPQRVIPWEWSSAIMKPALP